MDEFEYTENNHGANCRRWRKSLLSVAILIFITSCGPTAQRVSGRDEAKAADAISDAMYDLFREADPERRLALINRLQSDIPDSCIRSDAALACQSKNIVEFKLQGAASYSTELLSLVIFNDGSYCKSEMLFEVNLESIAEHKIYSIKRVIAGKTERIEIVGKSKALNYAGSPDRFLKACQGMQK